jgi:hypothetical protein
LVVCSSAACVARPIDAFGDEASESTTSGQSTTTDSSTSESTDNTTSESTTDNTTSESTTDNTTSESTTDSNACSTEQDCELFELCEQFQCVGVADATIVPDCELPPPETLMLDIPFVDDGLGALTFADLDDDQDHELVVALDNGFGIHVFDHGSLVATSWPNPISNIETYVVSGRVDDQPGDDIMMFWPGVEVWRMSADGMGMLQPAVEVIPPTNDSILWMAIDELDGQPPDEIVYMTDEGVVVQFGDGSISMIDGGVVRWGQIRALGTPHPGISIIFGVFLRIYDDAFALLHESQVLDYDYDRGGLTHLETLGQTLVVTSVAHSGWSLLDTRDLDSLESYSQLGVPGMVWWIGSGDFDGDGNQSLFYSDEGQLVVHEQLDGCRHVLPLPSKAESIAVGDYDGDGDDELAALTDFGVFVADYE